MQTADKLLREWIEIKLAKLGIKPYDGTTILAYVAQGRWVASCACNGAELVALGQEMLCGSCGARNTVKFPESKTRAKIEELLGRREPFNQNWYAYETTDELLAQNIENGIWED